MVEISKREKQELLEIMENLKGGWEFALVSDIGGQDLSKIQNALLFDILKEYTETE